MGTKIEKKEVVKVQVTFTKKQMEIMREYQDIFGESDAEIVRAIVMNWLAVKKEGSKNEGKEIIFNWNIYFIDDEFGIRISSSNYRRR